MTHEFALKLHRIRGGVGVRQGLFQRGSGGGDAQYPSAAGDQTALTVQLVTGVIDGDVGGSGGGEGHDFTLFVVAGIAAGS